MTIIQTLSAQPNSPATTRAMDDDALRAYRRDGVVLLQGVLTSDEVACLRSAVDRQFTERRRSKTAYDFQEMAERFWREGRPFSSDHADRFDLDRLTALVSHDPNARPLFDETGAETASAGAFFYEAAGWRTHSAIRDVACESRLPELCASLMQSASGS